MGRRPDLPRLSSRGPPPDSEFEALSARERFNSIREKRVVPGELTFVPVHDFPIRRDTQDPTQLLGVSLYAPLTEPAPERLHTPFPGLRLQRRKETFWKDNA